MVTLDELRLLFAGEHLPEDQPGLDGWVTRPSYRLPLVWEIARRTDPQTEAQLRALIYGGLDSELIDPVALQTIAAGFKRYHLSRGKRGL